MGPEGPTSVAIPKDGRTWGSCQCGASQESRCLLDPSTSRSHPTKRRSGASREPDPRPALQLALARPAKEAGRKTSASARRRGDQCRARIAALKGCATPVLAGAKQRRSPAGAWGIAERGLRRARNQERRSAAPRRRLAQNRGARGEPGNESAGPSTRALTHEAQKRRSVGTPMLARPAKEAAEKLGERSAKG